MQRPHGLHTQPSEVSGAAVDAALAGAVSQRFFLGALLGPLPQPPHPRSPCLCCPIVLTYQRVCVCVCATCVCRSQSENKLSSILTTPPLVSPSHTHTDPLGHKGFSLLLLILLQDAG